MTPSSFVKKLAAVSFPNVFNPYADTCPQHDRLDAPATRRANMRSYLSAVEEKGVDTIWMGRDLGYRGGRRTGLALTDEHHLSVVATLFPECSLSRATRGAAVSERTAVEIWALLRILPQPPLLWNVFPFHPHEPNDELSNRKFTRKELSQVTHLNEALLRWLQVKRVVAIGQDAQAYASQLGVEVVNVRHPSYGGITDFRAGIRACYGLITLAPAQGTLFNPS